MLLVQLSPSSPLFLYRALESNVNALKRIYWSFPLYLLDLEVKIDAAYVIVTPYGQPINSVFSPPPPLTYFSELLLQARRAVLQLTFHSTPFPLSKGLHVP